MRIKGSFKHNPRSVRHIGSEPKPMTPEQEEEMRLRNMVTDCALQRDRLDGWDYNFITDMATVTKELTPNRRKHIERIHAKLFD